MSGTGVSEQSDQAPSRPTTGKKSREAFFLWPKRPSRADPVLDMLKAHSDRYDAWASVCLPMLLFCGLAAILLPQEVIGLSAIAGVGGGAAGYWYYQLHEPSRDRKRIRQEAFDLANSPVAEVKFTNGDSCPFSPEGAVVATSRDVVFGIDTLNQLVRQIAIGQSGKLETDWIFGLEEFTEISVVKVPSGGLSKLAGKLSGVRNLTCPAIRLSTAARSHVHIRIVPDQLDTARNLVAKINMNRLSARQAT